MEECWNLNFICYFSQKCSVAIYDADQPRVRQPRSSRPLRIRSMSTARRTGTIAEPPVLAKNPDGPSPAMNEIDLTLGPKFITEPQDVQARV